MFNHLGGLTLPSREYYTARNRNAKNAFYKYISTIVSLLGGNVTQHADEIRDLVGE